MVTYPPQPSDLDTLLDLGGTINTSRASMLLSLAEDLCATVVSPVPTTASALVLSIAARAYVNPTGTQSQAAGPANVNYGPAQPGIYLTKAERATLQRLGGRGGAFTVDPTPSDAGTQLPPWEENVTWLEGIPLFNDEATSLDTP